MSIIRNHQLTNRPIIFSPRRGIRPRDFIKEEKKEKENLKNCPFCEGHEGLTPPEIMTLPAREPKDSPKWKIRTVPNKYSALTQDVTPFKKDHLFTEMSAYGYHEVIITKSHFQSFADLNDEMADLVVQAYQKRLLAIEKDTKIKYIQIIYNHGKSAGASLKHPHSQIFAVDRVPPYLMDENKVFNSYYKKNKKALLEDIIKDEIRFKKRIIKTTRNFIAWCPFASRGQFEFYVAPKKNCDFQKMGQKKREEFAKLFRDVLKRFKKVLKNPDYNFYFHVPPVNKKGFDNFHWHVEVLPRISNWAAFEYGTDMIINTVLPEDAAKMLTF